MAAVSLGAEDRTRPECIVWSIAEAAAQAADKESFSLKYWTKQHTQIGMSRRSSDSTTAKGSTMSESIGGKALAWHRLSYAGSLRGLFDLPAAGPPRPRLHGASDLLPAMPSVQGCRTKQTGKSTVTATEKRFISQTAAIVCDSMDIPRPGPGRALGLQLTCETLLQSRIRESRPSTVQHGNWSRLRCGAPGCELRKPSMSWCENDLRPHLQKAVQDLYASKLDPAMAVA